MGSQVQEIIAGWREKLLDLSKRNRLVNCRVGRSGAVLIEYPGIDAVWGQIAVDGKTLSFPWKHDLIGEPDLDEDGPLFARADQPTGAPAGGEADNNGQQSKSSEADDLEACITSGKLEAHELLSSRTGYVPECA